VEPALGILGDTRRRKAIVIGGGVAFGAALAATAMAGTFMLLLVAFAVFSPASGAFVSLSQATLMDVEPTRREPNMARWALAGSLGTALGPILLTAAVATGLGWRGAMLSLACMTVPLVLLSRSVRFHGPASGDVRSSVRAALGALRRKEVVRWLVLLETSDLMGGVLHGFIALYFVDVVGLDPAGAAFAVGLWTVSGLAGDALLLRLLRGLPGTVYLRRSALAVTVLYPLFLGAPGVPTKFLLLGLLGVMNAGWYAIPKGQLFDEMDGWSGAVLALSSISGLFGRLAPLAVGLLAERFGLGSTMWLLLLAPICLSIGVPRSGEPRRAKAR
jgi:FSR family fosmidomycin resistance protein-like MFS transporter